MYKFFFILIVLSLFFLIKIFSENTAVDKNKELISLIKRETGSINVLFKKDIGNLELNKLNIGYYVMFEGQIGERTLTLMENNTVKFTYPLNEKTFLSEIGFWKTNNNGKIEVTIIGNQFGVYDETRMFIFDVNHYDKKIISENYEKLIYGDGGLVFYRK